ncbi:peptidase S24/S26A/S26B/S26C [Circinella umbellata]|nr:peptidase S24/S26A/S26B/S26C [Circinella umbellata]
MGSSMLPTFDISGRIVGVEHITPHFRGYRMGDVVVCISPAASGRAVLKRIFGLIKSLIITIIIYILRVPEGHAWLSGANLSDSTDSRYHGPVAMGLICGRVFAKVNIIIIFILSST